MRAAWYRFRAVTATLCLGVAGVCLILLMLIGFGDVFARYTFNASIVQREELFSILLVVLFFTSFPVITWRHEHLDVDLLDKLFAGLRRRQAQLLMIDLVCAITCAAMSYWMFDKSMRISRPGREVMYEELGIQQSWIADAFAWSLALTAVVMTGLAIWRIVGLFAPRYADPRALTHKDNL